MENNFVQMQLLFNFFKLFLTLGILIKDKRVRNIK